ncbi:MAG TPA: NUDIX hydrolase [Verrucomicrobiota bacterium]|nr:NUDIX hydrolase [Verrucomicrobiota bacterium]
MPPDPVIQVWPKLSSRQLANYRIFSLRSDLKINPRTGRPHDFFVLDCPDWVNVIPVTRDDRIVMIEQYRHGSNTVELEIPGGVMDPSEHDPVATGVRELREETGYEGAQARLIGRIFPNPAIQSNTCHTLLVEQCELKHPTEFDQGEDIGVRLVPAEQIQRLIAEGKIQHALVVVALAHFLAQRDRR